MNAAAVLESLEATRTALGTLTERIEGLASKEELDAVKEDQAKRSRRIRLAFVAVAVVIGLVMLAGVGISAIVQDNRKTNRLLVECTTPGPRTPTAADPTTGHACYDEGQRRTGEAVAAILVGINSQIEHALERVGIPPESTTTTAPAPGR